MARRRNRSRKGTDTKMAKIIYPRQSAKGIGFKEELVPAAEADDRIEELKQEIYGNEG